MTETKYYQQDSDIWHQLVGQEQAYLETQKTFLSSSSRVQFVRKALEKPSERTTALKVIAYLTNEERQSLFDVLIKLASVGHSDVELVRQVILLFDKRWLLDNIENHAESVLGDTDEEYRRLLELYVQIDDGLSQRLVMKALRHPDMDIQEVGEDFEIYLKNKN